MSSTFGNGNVIVVEDDSLFNVEMERAGQRLVVVDFTASWCGPCRRIAPVFTNLSVQYMDVVFLKVDVDQCPLTAESNGIRAMPTFQFFKNKSKIYELKGGDAVALEAKIRDLRPPAAQQNNIIIDPKRVAIGQTWSCFEQLKGNESKVFMDVSELLLKFANNIMSDHKNPKYRSIRIGNKIFSNRLLPVEGGVECLFAMGFEESDDHLVLHTSTSLDALNTLRDTIQAERDKRNKCEGSQCSTSVPGASQQWQPAVSVQRLQSLTANVPLTYMTQPQLQFYAKLKSSSDHVMLYEDQELQRRARSHLPMKELEQKANEMSRVSKEGGEKGVNSRDCLVLVLLEWFKGFFKWVDKPLCKPCNEVGVYQRNGIPTLEDEQWGAGVVEEYMCPKCKQLIRFPRYNHPAKLLESRCGRCGEWANCFTMFCRVLGYETRHVIDWTDHVWTEVFSESQNRWLHCDSCECACDKPLVYEAGWGKKLSYVIAFSKEQVFDVTWRYSKNHEAVRMRRTQVPETWLADVTIKMTQQLQSILPEERRSQLQARSMQELIEFMTLKSATPDELQGRVSGSVAWRKVRGELGTRRQAEYKSYVFVPSKEDIQNRRLRIRYCTAIDNYYRSHKDDLTRDATPTLEDWKSGTNAVESIFRKVEHDWKKAYLARVEYCATGSITWKIDVSQSGHVIDSVALVISSETFEDGRIEWSVCGDDKERQYITLDGSKARQSLQCLHGSKTMTLKACLSGGTGSTAWQHAQLFRQSINSPQEEYPLDIDIQLT